MGLIDEHERNDLARRVHQYVENGQHYLQLLRGRLDELIAIKAESPVDAPEIDAIISQLKTALQNIIDNY